MSAPVTLTPAQVDEIERLAKAADWTVNAASYAASWAFEKLATPAAVRALVTMLRAAEARAAEAERQRDEAQAALEWYGDRENWRGHNPLAPRMTQCALDEGRRARAALDAP